MIKIVTATCHLTLLHKHILFKHMSIHTKIKMFKTTKRTYLFLELSQDETPPFRENWKAPFSHLSVTIQSTEWQVHFSDHSVTIQCHSVTIPSPFSYIHFPFFRIKMILYALFLHIFDARSPGIMSECNTYI